MEIPISYLTLFDYHYVSDIVDNKIGKRVEVPQSMIFELDSKLETDTLTKIKFEYATSVFEWFMSKNKKFLYSDLPRSTMYLLTTSFFYELIKEHDENTVHDWRYAFDVGVNMSDYLSGKIQPVLENNEIKAKVNRVLQQGLDRFISRVGLILEQRNEAQHSSEKVYNEKEIQMGNPSNMMFERNISSQLGTRRLHNQSVKLTFVMTTNQANEDEDEDVSDYIMLKDMISGQSFVICDANHHNNYNEVSPLNFRGYYFGNKTYNRCDSVIYNLGYFVCLKNMTFGEDVVDSKYWFKMPRAYINDYTHSIHCPLDDQLAVVQHNYIMMLELFDLYMLDINEDYSQ